MAGDSAILVSLRPRHAKALVSGDKTVELRRTRPVAAAAGQLVLLYAASPERQLMGTAIVAGVQVGSPDEIWSTHGDATGVSRCEFDHYFEGTSAAVAIVIKDARALSRPRPLAELRRRWHGFRPPQSFRYVAAADLAGLSLH